MATYVPNATDFTEPLESQTVESAALEFRTLKERVNALDAAVAADDLTDLRIPETSITVLPAIASRAGKVLGFDAGGDPAMVDVAGATDPSLRSDLAASSGANLVGYLQTGAGAVSMTVQAKLRESVSVLDYGSTGACIQAAIDALPATGGRIVIPDGTTLTVAATVTVNKPLELIVGACNITFTAAIGIEHTSGIFTITGAGDQISVFRHSGANHCIYSHSISSTVGDAQIGRFTATNIGLVDLLTTQPSSLFADWSTTRVAGAGILVTTPQVYMRGVNTFGFFDGVRASGILASHLEGVHTAWSGRDGIQIGAASTSVTLTGCYAFGAQRTGIRFEDNAWYCTLNSTASDASGSYGYYFGPGAVNGLSPFAITLNSIGCEEAGYLDPTSSSVYLEAVKNIVFNAPMLTGLGNRLANTCNGISFAGSPSTDVSINGGVLGYASSYLGGYGLYIPIGTYIGKMYVIGNLNSVEAVLGKSFDEARVIQYLGGQPGYSTLIESTEVITAGAVPTVLSDFYYPIPANTFVTFKVDAVAQQIAGAGGAIGQGAAYSLQFSYRDISGVVTSVGPTAYAYTAENEAGWTINTGFASGGVNLTVTAGANETVAWRYSVTRMQYP